MSLRYALLALLSVEAMTGYDLYKQFESTVGHVWYAPDSQIYPELRKMDQDGLIRGEMVPWGPRGKKRRYHITDVGIEAFRAWMNDSLEYSRARDRPHLKAAYLEWATPASAARQMREHIAHHTAQLHQWEENIREIDGGESVLLNRRLEQTPEADRDRTIVFKRFAYEGLITQAEQEIEWAKRGLRLIEELYS